MDLTQLNSKLENTRAAILSIHDAARGRDYTPAENCRLNTLEDTYHATLSQIHTMSTSNTTETVREQHERTSGRKTSPDAIGYNPTSGFHDHKSTTAAGPKFAQMFGAVKASNHFKSFNEFAQAIQLKLHHPGLMAAAGGVEGIGSAGGYMVPEEFVARMMDNALEDEIVRPRASIEAMSSDTKAVAGIDASSSASGTLFGGFSSQWLGEGESMTAQTPKWRLIRLKAKKLGILTAASNELKDDGVDYQRQLLDALTKAVSWALDFAFLRGDGASQPLGVLNSPSLIVVAKETGQAADSIVYENLTEMYARLHPACRGNAVWVVNNGAVPELLQLTIIGGVAGVQYPALNESNGQFSMLGRPVIFTEKLPALGDQGDILLADFSQYAVGLRREVQIAMSEHVGFQTDETYWRAIARADGQPKWDAAYTPYSGSTLSWAVTLAARA